MKKYNWPFVITWSVVLGITGYLWYHILLFLIRTI